VFANIGSWTSPHNYRALTTHGKFLILERAREAHFHCQQHGWQPCHSSITQHNHPYHHVSPTINEPRNQGHRDPSSTPQHGLPQHLHPRTIHRLARPQLVRLRLGRHPPLLPQRIPNRLRRSPHPHLQAKRHPSPLARNQLLLNPDPNHLERFHRRQNLRRLPQRALRCPSGKAQSPRRRSSFSQHCIKTLCQPPSRSSPEL
jgi:hypothetical protein